MHYGPFFTSELHLERRNLDPEAMPGIGEAEKMGSFGLVGLRSATVCGSRVTSGGSPAARA